MALSANPYPQDSFPSSTSLGALFGFRSSPHPSWRYEPPSLRKDDESLGLDPGHPTSLFTSEPTIQPEASSADAKSISYGTPYSFSQKIPHTHRSEAYFANRDGLQRKECTADVVAVSQKAAQDAFATVDFEAGFQAFRMRIAGASELSELDRAYSLINAFQACCPAHPDAWIYNTMVIKYLADIGWDAAPILGARHISNFAVPPTYAPENVGLLQSLDKMLLQFPHRLRHIHRLYLRLAETALSAEPSSSSSQDTVLLRLVRQLWQSAHSQNVRVKRSVMELLCAVTSKTRSRHSSRVLQAILADAAQAEQHIRLLVVRASENPESFVAAEGVFSCIPSRQLFAWIPSITLHFARAVTYNSRLSKDIYVDRMDTWLQLLQRLDLKSGAHGSSLLDTAIAFLARHVFADDVSSHHQMQTLMNALLLKMSQHSGFEPSSMTKISTIVKSFTSLPQNHKKMMSFDDLLGRLLSRTQKEGLLCRALAETIINILARHADLSPTLRFLNILDRGRLPLSNTMLLHEVIAKRMTRIRKVDVNSTHAQRQHVAFALRTCQKIFEVLSRISATSKASMPDLSGLQAQRQFGHILDRAQACHALPLAYHNITAHMPAERRVDLIHQLAHQHSTDSTRSLRESSRAIYYLYRYLQQNSLPIGPLFAKAVVRVSIARPLSENRFVSARRVIWVCQLVAKIEGEEVAKKIESVFWHWRGDLIKHAKSVYIGAGGNRGSKAHVGTMKKLGLI